MRTSETLWSLLIVVVTLAVIWFGYLLKKSQYQAPVETAVVRNIDKAPEAVAQAETDGEVTQSRPIPDDSLAGGTTLRHEFYAPTIVESFAHLSSLSALPSLGRIREPLLTPEWVESFKNYCVRVAIATLSIACFRLRSCSGCSQRGGKLTIFGSIVCRSHWALNWGIWQVRSNSRRSTCPVDVKVA